MKKLVGLLKSFVEWIQLTCCIFEILLGITILSVSFMITQFRKAMASGKTKEQ